LTLMLLLKLPVQVVLMPTVEHCARAGSDRPSDNGARQEAASSSNFRRFAATLEGTFCIQVWTTMAYPPQKATALYTLMWGPFIRTCN
jgi:hypothetical protein